MLHHVLGPAPDVRLQHVAAVQEGHLALRLDPDARARVRRDHVQRRHVQAEGAGLGEAAEAGAERGQLGARHVGGQVGQRERHVVDARAVQPEHVLPVLLGVREVGRGGGGGGGGGGRDERGEGAARVGGELGEDGVRLGLGERSHGRGMGVTVVDWASWGAVTRNVEVDITKLSEGSKPLLVSALSL